MDTKQQPAEPVLQPAREHRVLPLEDVEWRKSGAGPDQLTIRGHASIFNRLSLDLGGFRERIAPGAFTDALDGNPDVHALWDHDTRLVLARTKNKTLDLREDPNGLHFWAKVADTSYARDLRVLMERGDVDQASFAFTVAPGGDEWNIHEEDGEEVVERTINKIGELFDVTVTAQGAYPQTDTSVVAHMRSRLVEEIREGRLPDMPVERAGALLNKIVAPDEPVDVPEPQITVHVDGKIPSEEELVAAVKRDLDVGDQRNLAPVVEDESTHQDEVVGEKRAEELKALKAHSRTTLELTKRRLLDAENERQK
jgi:HK97 family phage prohead protease